MVYILVVIYWHRFLFDEWRTFLGIQLRQTKEQRLGSTIRSQLQNQ